MILAIYFFFLFQPVQAQIREMGYGYKYRGDPNAPAPVSACPVGLKILAKEDGDDTFFGLLENYKGICTKSIAHGHELESVHDLQLILKERHPNLSAAATSNIEKCFEKDTEAERYLAAKYYYELNRLQEGSKAALYQIASIDKLLPEYTQTMSGIECGHGYFLEARKLCTDLGSQCKAKDPKAFDALAEKAEAAYKIKMQYEELLALRRGMSFEKYTPGDPRYAVDKQIEEIRNLYSQALEESPWIKGTEFEKMMQEHYHKGKTAVNEAGQANLYKNSIRIAFREQLKFNRAKLNDQIKEFSTAAECFEGKNTEFCRNGKDLRRVLSKTPSTNIHYTGVRKENIGAEYLEAQQCVHDGKLDQDQTTDVLNDAAVGAALTVATGGLSVGVGVVRFGMTVRGLNAAGALVKEPAKVLATAYQAQRLGTVTRAGQAIVKFEAGMGLVDAGVAINNANTIHNKCQKERAELDRLVVQQQQEFCPSYDNSATQARDVYGACMFGAYLEGGAGTLSTLPFFAAIGSGTKFLRSMFGASSRVDTPPVNSRNVERALEPASEARPTVKATPNPSSATFEKDSALRPLQDTKSRTDLPVEVESKQWAESLQPGDSIRVPAESGFVNAKIIRADKDKVEVLVVEPDGRTVRRVIPRVSALEPYAPQDRVWFRDSQGNLLSGLISGIEGNTAKVFVADGDKIRNFEVPLTRIEPMIQSGQQVMVSVNGSLKPAKVLTVFDNTVGVSMGDTFGQVASREIVVIPKKNQIVEVVSPEGKKVPAVVQEVDGDSVKVRVEYGDTIRNYRVPLTSVTSGLDANRRFDRSLRMDIAPRIKDERVRKAYIENKFKGEDAYISYVDTRTNRRIGVRVIEVDPITGGLKATSDGVNEITIPPAALAEARPSQTSLQNLSNGNAQSLTMGENVRYYDESTQSYKYGRVIENKSQMAADGNYAPNVLIETKDINGVTNRRRITNNRELGSVQRDKETLEVSRVLRDLDKDAISLKQQEAINFQNELSLAFANPKKMNLQTFRQLADKQRLRLIDLQNHLKKMGYETRIRSNKNNIPPIGDVTYEVLEIVSGPKESLFGELNEIARQQFKSPIFIDYISNAEAGALGLYSPGSGVYLRGADFFSTNPDKIDHILIHEMGHAQTDSLRIRGVDRDNFVSFQATDAKFDLIDPSSRSRVSAYGERFVMDEATSSLSEASLRVNRFKKRGVESRYTIDTKGAQDEVRSALGRVREFANSSNRYLDTATKNFDTWAKKGIIRYETDARSGRVKAILPIEENGVVRGNMEVLLVKATTPADIDGNNKLLRAYIDRLKGHNQTLLRRADNLENRMQTYVNERTRFLRKSASTETAGSARSTVGSTRSESYKKSGPFDPIEGPPQVADSRVQRLLNEGYARERARDLEIGREIAVPFDGGFINARIKQKIDEDIVAVFKDDTGLVQKITLPASEVRKPFQKMDEVGFSDEAGNFRQTAIEDISGERATILVPGKNLVPRRVSVKMSDLLKPFKPGDSIQFVRDGRIIKGEFKATGYNDYRIEVNGQIVSVKPNEIILPPKSGDTRFYSGKDGKTNVAIVQSVEGDSARVLLESKDGSYRTARISLVELTPLSGKVFSPRDVARATLASDIKDTKFRNAYMDSDFRGDNQFVSIKVADKEVHAKILDVTPEGDVRVVTLTEERVTIPADQLTLVRQDPKSKEMFRTFADGYEVDDVIRYYDEKADQFIYGKIIERKKDGSYLLASTDIESKQVRRTITSNELASAIMGPEIRDLTVASAAFDSLTTSRLATKVGEVESDFRMAIKDMNLPKAKADFIVKRSNEVTAETADLLTKRGYKVQVFPKPVKLGPHTVTIDAIEIVSGPKDSLAGYIFDTARKRLVNSDNKTLDIHIDLYEGIAKNSNGLYSGANNSIHLNLRSLLKSNADDLNSTLYHELRHAKIQMLKEAKRENPFYVEFYSNQPDFNLLNPKASSGSSYNDYFSLDEIHSYLGEARLIIKADGAKVKSRYSVSGGLEKILDSIDSAKKFVRVSDGYLAQTKNLVAKTKPQDISYITKDGVVTAEIPLWVNGEKKGSVLVALVKADRTNDINRNHVLLREYIDQVIDHNKKVRRQIVDLQKRVRRKARQERADKKLDEQLDQQIREAFRNQGNRMDDLLDYLSRDDL